LTTSGEKSVGFSSTTLAVSPGDLDEAELHLAKYKAIYAKTRIAQYPWQTQSQSASSEYFMPWRKLCPSELA
jgi:hypothetical protein